MTTLEKWDQVQKRYDSWDSLLLGNGSSIAVHPTMAYPSLFSAASNSGHLNSAVQKIFTSVGTTNFEEVLNALRVTSDILKHLNISRRRSRPVRSAFGMVRDALIRTVRSVHPSHAQCNQHFGSIQRFAGVFDSVLNFNYDLILYWALVGAVSNNVEFKDGFINGSFPAQWQYLRTPSSSSKTVTMFFYPHGNLVLLKHGLTESKITSVGKNLLSTIQNSWAPLSAVPLFVSEGNSLAKQNSIQKSKYLSRVRDDVLAAPGRNGRRPRIAAYGLSFGGNDIHIVDCLARSNPEVLAISVLSTQSPTQIAAEVARLRNLLVARIPNTTLVFYASHSQGAWIY